MAEDKTAQDFKQYLYSLDQAERDKKFIQFTVETLVAIRENRRAIMELKKIVVGNGDAKNSLAVKTRDLIYGLASLNSYLADTASAIKPFNEVKDWVDNCKDCNEKCQLRQTVMDVGQKLDDIERVYDPDKPGDEDGEDSKKFNIERLKLPFLEFKGNLTVGKSLATIIIALVIILVVAWVAVEIASKCKTLF
jgi:hypothetical protein